MDIKLSKRVRVRIPQENLDRMQREFRKAFLRVHKKDCAWVEDMKADCTCGFWRNAEEED